MPGADLKPAGIRSMIEAHTAFPTPREAFQLLTPDGRLRVADVAISLERAKQMLRWMILSRELDVWGTRLQRMGRIGLYTPVLGQEATVVGAALALDPGRDWLVPAYREQAAWLIHGLPLVNLMATYMGKIDAARVPDGVNMLPRQQSVATQLPHAVGLAWAQELRHLRNATLVFCGDGATSEGDFHEACNFAGVFRVPLVIVVQNNGWAISTPTHRQTAAPSISVRAIGYGFPGITVDGNDVFAVSQATVWAVDRARAQEGPTLIECMTYRLGFHNTSDNADEYRRPEDLVEPMRFDPIARLERYLSDADGWTVSDSARVREDVSEEIKQALREAEDLPSTDGSAVLAHAYADSASLRRRRRQLA